MMTTENKATIQSKIVSVQTENKLSQEQQAALLYILGKRFSKHMHRHPNLQWSDIQDRLEAAPQKLWSLEQMEASGGEPDVIGQDAATGAYIFVDCAPESPKGRRSVCYDREGWESRKEHRPENTAVEMATEMGITLLTEAEYRQLQGLGPVDTKTSSWLLTPEAIRKAGGAIFGDYRYGHVFVYHNSAGSYYGVRGFRGLLRV